MTVFANHAKQNEALTISMKNRTENIIVIGDTHFGARNNSMTWLKHQTAGFLEILKYVEESLNTYDYTEVVHVGDLFDSRSAINPIVYREVVGLLNNLNEILKRKHMACATFIGGNHDYYYPHESENNYTGIQMLPRYSEIDMLVNGFRVCDNGFIFIPWFSFHNPSSLAKCMEASRYTDDPKKNIIFTHTDPDHNDPEIKDLVDGAFLVTGHIHQPDYRPGKLLITGASYPIDFADTNSERGFWNIIRQPGLPDKIEFHPIHSSIHFHTLEESELDNWENHNIKPDDYVEVHIRAKMVDSYKSTLKELNEKFNTTILYINEEILTLNEEVEVMNVDTVCKKLLPNNLKAVYEEMKQDCSITI